MRVLERGRGRSLKKGIILRPPILFVFPIAGKSAAELLRGQPDSSDDEDGDDPGGGGGGGGGGGSGVYGPSAGVHGGGGGGGGDRAARLSLNDRGARLSVGSGGGTLGGNLRRQRSWRHVTYR